MPSGRDTARQSGGRRAVGDGGRVTAGLHSAGAVPAVEREGRGFRRRWRWRWSGSVGATRASGCGCRRATSWRKRAWIGRPPNSARVCAARMIDRPRDAVGGAGTGGPARGTNTMRRPKGAIEDRYEAPDLLMPDRAAEFRNDSEPLHPRGPVPGRDGHAHAEALAGRPADRAGTMGLDRRIGACAEARTCEGSIHGMRTFFDEVRVASESDRRFHAVDCERAGVRVWLPPAVARSLVPELRSASEGLARWCGVGFRTSVTLTAPCSTRP